MMMECDEYIATLHWIASVVILALCYTTILFLVGFYLGEIMVLIW